MHQDNSSSHGKRRIRRLTREESQQMDARLRELVEAGTPWKEVCDGINAELGLKPKWTVDAFRKRIARLGLQWIPTPKATKPCSHCVPYQDLDQESYIICPYCKEEGRCPYCKENGRYPRLRRISPSHLALHGKNMDDLRREHPDAVITSTATRKANKAQWAVPKIRRRRIKGLKRGAGTPQARAKHSVSMKSRWLDPVQSKPLRDHLDSIRSDPEIQERQLKGLRKKLRTRKVRRRFSAATRRDWQRKEVREKYLTHISKMVAERKQRLAEADRVLAKRNLPRWRKKPKEWRIMGSYLLVAPGEVGNDELAELIGEENPDDANFTKRVNSVRNWVGKPGRRGKRRK